MPNLAENFVDWMGGLDAFDGVSITHIQAVELDKTDESITVAVNIPEPVDANDIGLGDECDDVVIANVTLFGRNHIRLRDITRSFKESLKTLPSAMINTTEIKALVTMAHVYGIESTRDDRVEYSRLTMQILYSETAE